MAIVCNISQNVGLMYDYIQKSDIYPLFPSTTVFTQGDTLRFTRGDEVHDYTILEHELVTVWKSEISFGFEAISPTRYFADNNGYRIGDRHENPTSSLKVITLPNYPSIEGATYTTTRKLAVDFLNEIFGTNYTEAYWVYFNQKTTPLYTSDKYSHIFTDDFGANCGYSNYSAAFGPVIVGETSTKYPITYHFTNSVVSGPAEAAVGDTVTVSAVPDVGYGITDASTQILVTNNDIAVPYTWDATNNRITFTMPEGAVTVTVTASLIPTYPITYRPTRVTLDGPATAAVGATVNVDCTFPEGYGVKTTDSITVTCNRVPVPFSWDAENQRITFTMPDPTA